MSKTYTKLTITAVEKRLVECDYIWYISEYDGGKEEAQRIIEMVRESPLTIDQLGYDDVEDLEIIKSEVVDSYPSEARVYMESSGETGDDDGLELFVVAYRPPFSEKLTRAMMDAMLCPAMSDTDREKGQYLLDDICRLTEEGRGTEQDKKLCQILKNKNVSYVEM